VAKLNPQHTVKKRLQQKPKSPEDIYLLQIML
jgi:hypothetical protein